MAVPSQTEVEKQLAALQLAFKSSLPAKISAIEKLWGDVCQTDSSGTVLVDLHRIVHGLTGSGGTFGAVVVSTAARELEQALKLLLNEPEETRSSVCLDSERQQQLNALITLLRHVSENWQPSNIPYIQSVEKEEQRVGNLIYLVDDDELLAADLITKLEHVDFQVKYFNRVSDFEAACEREMPVAIIMDMVFNESDVAGAEVIQNIKNKKESCPPVIFISVRNDIEVRLAAARAGASRYLCKPLDFNKLQQTLNGLTARTISKPYRVLIVDDDESLLQYYATVLRDARIDVKTLSDSLQALKVLEEFKPDVIVLDVYMPECSGPELAQVIRQDDAWAQTPIMFLSTESDLNRQLAAMNLGGDDFLVKPVAADHLVSAVLARAKRARWTSRLNLDLAAALRESEFQTVTMDQHDIVSCSDVTGTITSVNDKFCEISGYSREELIGQNHRLLKSNYHPSSFYKDMWKTIANGQVWHGTICNHKKNGEEYWVDSTIVPFIDDKGKPYKYVSARTDVTLVRKNEERLERSQDFANIGSWDWNIETGALFWSDRIWPLFGYDKSKTKTTYDNFLAAIHPEDRQLVTDAITHCIESADSYNIEHRVIWPDGSIHWLHESGDVVRDVNGKAVHMLGVVQDITKRKLTEESLIFAREEAENANRAKSQFLSSMSHELRTPMNAIMGFGQLLAMDVEQPLNVNQQENVGEIMKASEHLLELINEVLDLAKIEAGRIDLSIEDVLLGHVITESLHLIMPLAEKRGISVELFREDTEINISDLDKDQNIVRADHTRAKQVILNLLSNAVKYNSKNGKIIIKCEKSDNHNIRISITDTGQGLTKEQQELLFTAFNRLGAESTEVEGTGIGLVITQNIVELMGGRIGFESAPGAGSTFWFELPTGSYELANSNKAKLLSGFKIDLEEERTVLYIEDNPANLRLVTQLLSRLPNLHMWSAHEPMLGLEVAMDKNPDLILLDINLPGMNGFEVLKLLRQRDVTRNTPVIAISANAMPKDIEKGLEAGFDDYITKPIDIQVLLESVDNKLKK